MQRFVVVAVFVTGCAFDNSGEPGAEVPDAPGAIQPDAPPVEPIDAAPPDAVRADATPPCAAGYHRQVMGGSCYKDVIDRVDWPTAEANCELEGAHLVIIDDVVENDLISALTIDAAWIGYSDRVTEGTFRWVNGVIGDGKGGAVYDNWNPGEPNDAWGEDCAEMINSGVWNDVTCADQLEYVCEIDGVPADPNSY